MVEFKCDEVSDGYMAIAHHELGFGVMCRGRNKEEVKENAAALVRKHWPESPSFLLTGCFYAQVPSDYVSVSNRLRDAMCALDEKLKVKTEEPDRPWLQQAEAILAGCVE